MLNRGELTGLCLAHSDRIVDEIMRLREALSLAGNTCAEARKIADEALAIWPKVDTFQTRPPQ